MLGALGAVVATLALPGLSDLLVLSGACALASLIILAQAWRRRTIRGPKAPPRYIVVDGSNVIHWKDETPQIDTLRAVLRHLTDLGYSPGVVFDANAGYKITGRYQHDGALGRLLGLPEDRVMVVAKGTPADPTVLTAARDLGARVVSNDRFRDWAETFPEVLEPGHVVRGGYRGGKLWIGLE
ncbi:MAG: hypothetical protein Q8P60_04055 [Pseudorhodobacter sp.]|nr:hypothetical protein [Pseudorhodobacter sp.]